MSGSLGKSRWKTWTLRTVGALLALVLLALLAAWLFLRASLAQLDGERRVEDLAGQVKVERDAAGVPLISGASRLDVAYATGFVHGQERFFQMDLLRRTAAGELAELFGAAALPTDRTHRLHRFRARALDTLARLPAPERALLERYAQGVNEGLGALGARPFEYALTGAAPRPWTAPDSLLVVWAMYIDLQGAQQARELARGWLRAHSDAAQLAFLLPEETPYDATLDATPGQGAPKAAGPLPPRAPAWWGAAPREPGAPVRLAGLEVTDSVGSNNYALAGSRSSTGAAIVADDMHLGLRLPNIWYRLALRFPDPGAPGGQRRLAGVSLPGAPPSVIVGSNGQVAWAFTNSYADSLDLVELRVDPARPNQVGLPGGWETPREHVEEIAVKGAAAERMVVRETSLGPIREVAGRSYALHWIAHDPAALNMNHLKLETVANVDDALAAAASNGIPAQNFVAGDVHGNIGWTVAGLLPRRAAEGQAAGIAAGIAAGFPLAAGSAAQTWSEALPYADYPRIVNPADGQITTANSRQLSGAGYALLGDGGYDLGQRNRQLHEGLQAMGDQVDVRRAFDGALDDRAILVGQWRQRALAGGGGAPAGRTAAGLAAGRPCFVARPAIGGGGPRPRGPGRCRHAAGRGHLGPAQHRRHRPSDQHGRARAAPLARRVGPAAGGRRPHAARGRPEVRPVGAADRVAGARRGGPVQYAGRAERPSAVAILSAGPRGLGRGQAGAVAAGGGEAHLAVCSLSRGIARLL